MRRAFVSHSARDDSYVAELDALLRAAGFDDVFNDVNSIKPDEQFWSEIESGIGECDMLFVVITAAATSSDWVRREVEFARRLGKKVIPLLVEDCPVPPVFADRDVIDLRRKTRELLPTDITRIFKYAPAELVGRENEKKLISDAWGKALRGEVGRPNVLTFVVLGGEGKTSLVAKWVVDEMSAKGWPGCDSAFAWSFYSQGTREQMAASSDLFLKEALNFFASGTGKEIEEVRAFAASPVGAYEKGQHLARLVGQRRSLLILDGLEPLQYAPTSPTPGQLNDQGIATLLKGLAASSHGLCLVTTRYSLPDLKNFWQTTVLEKELKRLSKEAGVALLRSLKTGKEAKLVKIRGTQREFEDLVEAVMGHPLTLCIIGNYLLRAFGGDIRQRDRVKLEKADESIDGGHAFRAMAAYAKWMEGGSDEARRELAVLRCLGLFDRPATRDCLAALLQPPAIAGLTEPLVGVAEEDWNLSITALEFANLVSVTRDASATLDSALHIPHSLDTHPHIREYFAKELREKSPDAWRAAHRRLYEHLCATTKEGNQPTLEDLQPLYQAVAHGCHGGLQQEALYDVLETRIWRGAGFSGFYSAKKLGAFGSDLSAIASFFEVPWRRVCPTFPDGIQASLIGVSAFELRALGRLTEALEPMRAGLEMRVRQAVWTYAALEAGNLSELELTLGDVVGAVREAEQSVTYADRSGDVRQRTLMRTTHAGALHQAGHRAEAETRFREAQQIQKEVQPEYPLLYSLQGFQYCDLLLDDPEHAAWQVMQGLEVGGEGLVESCRAVSQRVVQTLEWGELDNVATLDIALDHLTLGFAALYEAILSNSSLAICHSSLETAMSGLRRAGAQEFIVRGLLTRAWLRFLTGARTGPESALEDLDEAWEIAERGPMRLHMADIHLYRARLFGTRNSEFGARNNTEKYSWESPAADLAAAERLINDCGYHRRDEELADAKRAILGW
ncbi:MAG TPA: toll/interleukin-1 receptor domain-containing protein [Verrucomicrobiota bacterium]|nr:hypothetical protein [Verrucomicrobiales bacterium]HRI15763.1 toll/interleukin-1 receptor domain-containing protein [Verrucomicrobiota bacterium]